MNLSPRGRVSEYADRSATKIERGSVGSPRGGSGQDSEIWWAGGAEERAERATHLFFSWNSEVEPLELGSAGKGKKGQKRLLLTRNSEPQLDLGERVKRRLLSYSAILENRHAHRARRGRPTCFSEFCGVFRRQSRTSSQPTRGGRGRPQHSLRLSLGLARMPRATHFSRVSRVDEASQDQPGDATAAAVLRAPVDDDDDVPTRRPCIDVHRRCSPCSRSTCSRAFTAAWNATWLPLVSYDVAASRAPFRLVDVST